MHRLAIAVGLLSVACVRESPPPEAPSHGYAGYVAPAYVLPAGGPWSHFVPGPALGATATPVRASAPLAPIPQAEPPGAEGCLERLRAAGVDFQQPGERRGVVTPVVIQGGLAGVDYVAGAGLPLELDCRMALTLVEVAPVLRALGVTRFRFSGAYVYRMSRVGRLSLHAHGLAIDLHAAEAGGAWHEVKTAFTKNLADGCATEAPVLNRIACELKKTGRFRELLTPDYNADHHDHFHLGIAPEPGPARDQRNVATTESPRAEL
ncbi:MAG: extensin family protein [Polyangiaceae bacterium]|nr:extensin family protein [Polyangiaceae bacterium]